METAMTEPRLGFSVQVAEWYLPFALRTFIDLEETRAPHRGRCKMIGIADIWSISEWPKGGTRLVSVPWIYVCIKCGKVQR